MKRFFLLFLTIILAVVLCSCGEPPTVSDSFSADFSVTQNEVDYQGDLTLSNGDLSISFTAPYTTAGMRFDYDAEGMSISLGGLKTTANNGYIPASSVPEVLHNTLAYLSEAAYTGSDESGDHFTLPTPYGDAFLTAYDGLPTALYDPHTQLSFTFTSSDE